METTRHFTTTVYVVNDGAAALHDHPKLDTRLPPGGHVDRDELPHEAAKREVREETGLDPDLVRDLDDVPVPNGRPLPRPAHQLLYDVNVHPGGEVGHQHVVFVYYARVPSREIAPLADDEQPADAWEWFGPADLRSAEVDPDTALLAREAIDAVAAMD